MNTIQSLMDFSGVCFSTNNLLRLVAEMAHDLSDE